MIDTHCHLGSSRYKKDRAEVMERAREAGVTRFVEVGYDLPTSERGLALAAEHADVWAAIGLHPHEVARAPSGALERLGELARDPRTVAIGECGLDFYRDLSPRDLQRDWFERQIALAVEVDKPLVVHVRDAMDEAIDRLERARPPRAGVLHCYSGNAAQALRAAGLGFALGFGGSLTYGDAALEEAARVAPAEALLLETDAPYLVPEPRDTKRNEPALLARVRARLAALRGVSEEVIDDLTTQNATRLFAPRQA
ncbi:MAG: TatD family hydrolase [Candidatus Eisenbacteria bacterium]